MNRRHVIAPIALGALVLMALVAGAVSRSSAQTAPPQRFTLYSGNVDNADTPLLVEAVGSIHGVGSASAKEGATDVVPLTFTLPGGKVFVRVIDDFQWKPNLKTCTATERSTGPYRITGGTGAYRHASGRGRFVERGAGIGQRSASGACQQKFKVNYVVANFISRS